MRGQVNIADEAKVRGPVRSTFEALVVRCVVGRGCEEELGSFRSPMSASDIAVFGASYQFAEHTSQM